MTISERIRLIISRKKLQDQEFAKLIGLEKATLSQRFSNENWKVSELLDISNATGYSFSWICEGFGPELESEHLAAIELYNESDKLAVASEPKTEFLSGKSIRTVTAVVDRQGKELISYVAVKAQAGYMRGFGDSHFLENLPAFSLPLIKEGTYRMFQVDGDSMRQLGGGGLHDGDIVISQYVEDIFSLKDNRVYVLISTEGVIVKRVINRLRDKENPVLVCNSDNKSGQYPAIILHPKEILEVWELKAYISKQLSFATDLWDVINDMQVQHALLKDKIDKLEQMKLL